MATLSAQDRARTVAQWMRDNRVPTSGFVKADLALAVGAIDDYFDNMVLSRPATSLRTAVNSAAPNFIAGASNAVQQDVLGYVMMRRANHLVAQEDGG